MYYHGLSCTILYYHVLSCTVMYYHVLLSVPGKKMLAYSAKQATEKTLEQNCFLALPPRHWQAWDKLHVCRPPESTNSYKFTYNMKFSFCSAKRFKPDFCKDCRLATPQKQRGHYAPRYFVLGGMLLLCHTVPLIICICLIRNKYFENL